MKKWLLVWLLARHDHSAARAANQSCVSLQCCLLRCDFFIALLSLLSIFLSLSLEPLYPGLAGFNGLHRAYFPLYPGALDSPDFVPRSCRAVPGRVLPPSMPTYGYYRVAFLDREHCLLGAKLSWLSLRQGKLNPPFRRVQLYGRCMIIMHVPV